MKRILLYGGAFNPPHRGHELLLKEAAELIKPDLTIVAPSKVSPHKNNAKTAFADRFAMAKTFLSCGENIKISGIEKGGRHDKSYTYKTVRRIKKKYPDGEIYLLIGSDMLITFEGWHRYRRLIADAVIVAALRDDADESAARKAADALEKQGARIELLKFEPIEISSTELRKRLADGSDTGDMLSGYVKEYISKRNLYKNI